MSKIIEFTEYLDANGTSPFAKWFDTLDAVAAAKVRVYMTRVELGNYSNVEPIGAGLSEIKIDAQSLKKIIKDKLFDDLFTSDMDKIKEIIILICVILNVAVTLFIAFKVYAPVPTP